MSIDWTTARNRKENIFSKGKKLKPQKKEKKEVEFAILGEGI